MNWIKFLIGLLPKKGIIDLIINLLEDFVDDTENKIDDEAVKIIKAMLYKAFGFE